MTNHEIRQEVPWPPSSEALFNITRFRCSCGWVGVLFPDSRHCYREREAAQREAEIHTGGN